MNGIPRLSLRITRLFPRYSFPLILWGQALQDSVGILWGQALKNATQITGTPPFLVSTND